MNEEPVPGDTPADRDLARLWRQQSTEEPSPATDARIRDAARQNRALRPQDTGGRSARSASRWSRFMPLAAAASVAVLAVGLVRLIPREDYQAIPAARDAPFETQAPRSAAPETFSPDPPRPQTPPGASSPAEASSPAAAFEREEKRQDMDAVMADPAAPPAPVVHPPAATSQQPAATVDSGTMPSRESPANERTPQSSDAQLSAVPERRRSESAGAAVISATGAAVAAASAELPDELASRVLDDAARRANVDPGSILIIEVNSITWVDGSLGCKAPRTTAPEQRVPGYVVTVDASGTILRYHTDQSDQVRHCDDE